jgi:bifunctional oligoribonuclease and PAP phosphatase NrnA
LPQATSTAEILADLLPALGVPLTLGISSSLLTGLVTDTLCFRVDSVSGHTLKVAGRLLETGADLAEITRQALILRPHTDVLLWRVGLNKARLEDWVAWTTITHEEWQSIGDGRGSTDGLGNFMADVQEAAMSAVFSERENGQVVVSFRSRPPYDVAALAVRLGGGGHRYAAGCTLTGKLLDVEARVVRLAKEMMAAQRLALGLMERAEPTAVS